MASQPSEKDAATELRRAAHEMNNLIAVLLGHSEAMARSLPPADTSRKHLDAIMDALSRSSDTARRFSAILNGVDPAELGALLVPSQSSQQTLSGTETVLLADDEAALRSVTARFLSMNGYKVLEASDADQARTVYEKAGGTVDVVVTDVMMGVSNGLDLGQFLRGKNPAVKVLYVSGNRPSGLRDAEFLAKPFRPKDLLRRLREILDGSSPGSSS